jgi:hypothetical protein
MTEIGERATMPGICQVLPAAMDWRAQQHMVKQWGKKRTAKQEELQAQYTKDMKFNENDQV